MVDGEDRRVSGNRVSGVLASLESRCLFRLHTNNQPHKLNWFNCNTLSTPYT